MPVPDIEIEPDMTPPTGRTVREMLGESSDDPPKKRTSPPKKPSAKQVQDDWDTLREDLTSAYEFLGFTLVTAGLPNGGSACADNAERAADSLVAQAQKSERMRRFLMTVTTGSGWLAIALVHMPIAMAIMGDIQNRGEVEMPENMSEVYEDLMSKVEDRSEY